MIAALLAMPALPAAPLFEDSAVLDVTLAGPLAVMRVPGVSAPAETWTGIASKL